MALSGLTPPNKIRLAACSRDERIWSTFKEEFGYFMLSAGFKDKSGEEQVALLLNVGGEELREIYKSFDWNKDGDPDESVVYKTVLAKFDGYFHVQENELSARKQFSICTQRNGETVEGFITRIKTLVKDCNFKEEKNLSMRDRLVFGCRDENLREKFFKQDYKRFTWERAVEIATAYEQARRQMSACREMQTEETVHAAYAKKQYHKPPTKRGNPQAQSTRKTSKYPARNPNNPKLKECDYCGRQHIWGKDKCPAFGKTCARCQGKNHFAVKCGVRSGTTTNDNKSAQKVNSVSNEYKSDSDSESEPEWVFCVRDDKSKKNDKTIFVTMQLLPCDTNVKFQIDTGATVNVMPKSKVSDVRLEPADTVLKTWNSSQVKVLGKCRLIVRNLKTRKKYSVECVIVDEKLCPILSKQASEQMKLVTINYENIQSLHDDVSTMFSEFKDVFTDEIGTLPGKVHLTIDSTVQPVAVASCRVPVSIKDKVKQKLDELKTQKIIVKVDEPTEWVSRMVANVKRNDDIRICIDPLVLNQALKREMHPLPVIDDVLPELTKARVFTKLDLRNGYWHCMLDEESSYLTTFQTPVGRYRWARLPFGLSVSSEIFQKRLHQALDGLENCICVADDILVFGVGESDKAAQNNHDANLRKLLKKCREQGIRLNREKTVLCENEVTFLGHKIGRDGLKADPTKIEAILKMEAPTNVTEVQRLNGMINYLSKFMPKLSDVLKPIRKLTLKDIEWSWDSEQEQAFQEIKELVTSTPVLAYYDKRKPLVIQCDSSQFGIGSVLLQDGKPICYASRAMTPTETRYAQIEKEMLAVVFSLSKFHQYTFGRKTKVYTDHKPLQAIVRKALCLAPKRIQGMMLKIQQYDIDLEYLPGKEMYIADLLSRSYLPSTQGAEKFDYISNVSQLPVRKERLLQIQHATENDDVMKKLRDVIIVGWPEEKSECPSEVHPYFNFRDEMSVQDGLIFKGTRVVIPIDMRKEVREALHSTHTGVEGCLRRARDCVYWPCMNNDLKEYISKCDVCNTYNSKQQKETLLNHEITDRPWQQVGVDLFEIKGKDFLVTVDYYSNLWEVDQLPSTTSNTVIKKLKSHFARYGIPSVLVSDNGPQFVSGEFSQFTTKWDIEHRTSSPGRPQGNGMAESAVKMAKRIIQRALDSKEDVHLAILEYRNVPTQDAGLSPAQRMFGRMTRTLLPVKSELLKPKDNEIIKKNQHLRNLRKEWYYNKAAKDLEPLSEGQTVRIRPMTLGNDRWRKGTITNRFDERSYEVDCGGNVYRRNRQDLKATAESLETNPLTDNQRYDEPVEIADARQPDPVPMENHPEQVVRRSSRQTTKPKYLKDYVSK